MRNILAMTVFEWLKSLDRSERWLARQVEIESSHLWRMLHGERPVPPDLSKKIAELSGNKVKL